MTSSSLDTPWTGARSSSITVLRKGPATQRGHEMEYRYFHWAGTSMLVGMDGILFPSRCVTAVA